MVLAGEFGSVVRLEERDRNSGRFPDLGFCRGAGDGNRTRTVSLGIRAIRAVVGPDLRDMVSASDRRSGGPAR